MTTHNNLVSVILCTYNGADYLKRQLSDIISQSYKQIEIVILDDCSSDETVTIIKEFVLKDARITFIENEMRLGYNKNFEKGCRLAKGNFIAIADQDDVWATDKIEMMLKMYDSTSLLIHCNSKKFFTNEAPSFLNNYKAVRFSGVKTEKLFFENTCEGHTMIFKKQLLEYALPFPEGIYYDWWLAAVASANGGVQWVNKTLVARRMHVANASENVQQPVSIKIFTVTRLKKFYDIPNISEAAKHIITTAIQHIENGSTKELAKFFYKNRSSFFYYKKSPLPFISYNKAANKLAAKFNQ